MSGSWFRLRTDGKHVLAAQGYGPLDHDRDEDKGAAWPQERISLVGLVNLVGGSHSMKSRRRGSHRKVVADILVEACSGMAAGVCGSRSREGLQEEGPGVQVETESWSGLRSC